MANQPGDPVHGEAIIDGDASAGVPVILYWPGSVQVRTLAADEVLHITDIQIACETAADTWLCADGKVAGEYVVYGAVAVTNWFTMSFQQPRACPRGTGLIFFGAATNKNACIIEGFITK